MHSPKLRWLIWAGSISKTVHQKDVSDLARFHALSKKEQFGLFLVVSSWTNATLNVMMSDMSQLLLFFFLVTNSSRFRFVAILVATRTL